MSKKTLLILDGHNITLRAYFGLLKQNLRTREGIGTWGVYGSINSLASYIRKYEPTHILVAFDKGRSKKRIAVDPNYKANRISVNGADETYLESRRQINLFQDFCNIAGIKTLRIQDVEADDIIARAAHEYRDYFDEIVIVSADHDIRQLIDEKTVVVKPSLSQSRKVDEEVFTREAILEQYGIEPYRLPEIWALMGDKGDNIPGVPGIGEKTAIKLIQKHGSINKALENEEPKLVGHEEVISKAYEMIYLDGNEDIDFPTLEALQFNPISNESLNASELYNFLTGLEMSSIVVRWTNGTLWKDPKPFGRKLGE